MTDRWIDLGVPTEATPQAAFTLAALAASQGKRVVLAFTPDRGWHGACTSPRSGNEVKEPTIGIACECGRVHEVDFFQSSVISTLLSFTR